MSLGRAEPSRGGERRAGADNVFRHSFFDEIKRIGTQGYVPNEADVLHARTKTTGISETKFKSGQLSIQSVALSGFLGAEEHELTLLYSTACSTSEDSVQKERSGPFPSHRRGSTSS